MTTSALKQQGPKARFTEAHVRAWREDGFAIIENFLSAEDIAPVLEDYDALYGDKRLDEEEGDPERAGEFQMSQFRNMDELPFKASLATNLLPIHPALVDFARALLDVRNVHLYQAHSWAKFTGNTNYEQPFHCDFRNHTLTVPGDGASRRAVNFILYFTDVTDAHGALHYVTKPDVRKVLGDGDRIDVAREEEAALRKFERSAAVPAGSLVAHGIDTFHRGTNLTAPGGHRYSMTCGYKAAGNDNIGYNVWQWGPGRDWSPIIEHGSPDQLTCLGIPAPGDPFWTERTLSLTQRRYPGWDMSEYFKAAGVRPND